MTQTGRPDLDPKVHFLGRDTQTPHFVLKAGDSCAAMAVRAYAQLLTTAGGDPAMVELAHRQADAMARWPHQKLPDMEFADEVERKRLTYEGERRAWCWGDLSDVAIAELRGRNEALDLMADVLRALEPHDDGTFVYTPPEGAVDPLSILAELMEARRGGAPKPPTNPRVARAEADARAYAKTCYVGGKRLAEVEAELADARAELVLWAEGDLVLTRMDQGAPEEEVVLIDLGSIVAAGSLDHCMRVRSAAAKVELMTEAEVRNANVQCERVKQLRVAGLQGVIDEARAAIDGVQADLPLKRGRRKP